MTNLTDLSHFKKDCLISSYFSAVGKFAQSSIGCSDVSSIKKAIITTVQWVYHVDVFSDNIKQKQSFLQSIVRPAIEQVKTFIHVSTERLNFATTIFLLLERFLVVLKSPHGLFR